LIKKHKFKHGFGTKTKIGSSEQFNDRKSDIVKCVFLPEQNKEIIISEKDTRTSI
jgi:hypothetical protein